MPHFPKPFFRPSRGLWYVQIDGKQHNLGPDESAAFAAYHKLLTQPQAGAVRSESVLAVIDEYLECGQKYRAAETYRWYLDRLPSFAKTIDKDLTVAAFRPFHVLKWVDAHADWSNGTRRNAIASVKRVLRWSQEQGYFEVNSIALMKKPACGRKEQIVPPADFQRRRS